MNILAQEELLDEVLKNFSSAKLNYYKIKENLIKDDERLKFAQLLWSFPDPKDG